MVEIASFTIGKDRLGPCLTALFKKQGIELKDILLDKAAMIRLMGMQPPLETRAANETIEQIFSSLELSVFLAQDQTLYILGDKGNINLLAAGIATPTPTTTASRPKIEPPKKIKEENKAGASEPGPGPKTDNLISPYSPAGIQAFVKEALKNRRMSTGAIFKRVCEMGRGILIGDLLATGRFYSKIIGEVADSRTKPIVTMISLFEKTIAKGIIEERLATERLAALIGYIIGDASGDITTRLEHFNDVTRSWSARHIGIALSAALAGQLWHQDQAIEHAVLNGRNRNEINEGMRLYYSLK
ncbi:MAG: hypothetical protein WC632_01400 [Candidatus Margulisiibacteriota bacterium]